MRKVNFDYISSILLYLIITILIIRVHCTMKDSLASSSHINFYISLARHIAVNTVDHRMQKVMGFILPCISV